MYEVSTFEMGKEWFADIVREDGVVLWTTDPCETKEDAVAAAYDVINEQYSA